MNLPVRVQDYVTHSMAGKNVSMSFAALQRGAQKAVGQEKDGAQNTQHVLYTVDDPRAHRKKLTIILTIILLSLPPSAARVAQRRRWTVPQGRTTIRLDSLAMPPAR